MEPGTPNTYVIDTSTFPQIENETIELVFNCYSGNPSITISPDAQFSKKIEVSRNHPSISVELTPQMRRDNKFLHLVYVKIEAEMNV